MTPDELGAVLLELLSYREVGLTLSLATDDGRPITLEHARGLAAMIPMKPTLAAIMCPMPCQLTSC